MIRTNNHWRPFRYRTEVPARVLADQFDYQGPDVLDGFFCYRGAWYHLDQFMTLAIDAWDGSLAESAFSGVVIKLHQDGEHYRVGRWLNDGPWHDQALRDELVQLQTKILAGHGTDDDRSRVQAVKATLRLGATT